MYVFILVIIISMLSGGAEDGFLNAIINPVAALVNRRVSVPWPLSAQ